MRTELQVADVAWDEIREAFSCLISVQAAERSAFAGLGHNATEQSRNAEPRPRVLCPAT